MSLREDCKDFMSVQLERAVTDKQADDIEQRIRAQMKLLAMKDPEAWRGLGYYSRLQRAASEAAKEMAGEFKRKQQNVQLQIDAHNRIENVLAAFQDREPTGAEKLFRFLRNDRLAAVSRLADFDTRGFGMFSVHSRTKALQGEMMGELQKAWDAMPGKFWGLFENKEGTDALWKELHGEDSGNPLAKAGAAKFHEVAENARQRFNDGGGGVGKLENWGIPQHHSQQRVAAAGLDKWTADILPRLDRNHFLNIDGSRMSNGQMHDFLAHAFDSIVTDGQNSRDPGNVAGLGAVANRDAAHRALFFKDSKAHAEYNTLYGERSLVSVMQGHVARMARDISLVETLGPNAERTFRYFNDRALQDEIRANPERASQLKADHAFNEALFDSVAGRDKVVNQRVANTFQGFRNWMTATRLGKVFLTALGDEAGMASTAWANRAPYSAAFLRELKTLNPTDATDRRVAQAAGLGWDSAGGAFNRFGQEEFGQSWTGKLAQKTLQVSGAERMWEARRQGLGSVIMSSIGSLTRRVEHVTDLNAADHGVLASKGVTDATWQVWRRAEPENWGAGAESVLTPKSIWSIPDSQLKDLGNPTALKREASTQLLAHTLEEAGMGAMDTGPRQRVSVNLGTQRGSIGGELWRSANLFRSFSFSMMMKHWARASQMGPAGAARYMAPLMVYGTLIAGLGNQVRGFLAGQNPDDMTTANFWGRAFLRGGGLGFFGDFLQNEVSQHDTSLAAALGGPAATTVENVLNLTHGAFFKSRRGETADEGPKLVRFLKENVPFTNLWYTQAAFDHLLWNHMQEAARPGYLERMEARQEKLYGHSYWWHPSEGLPSEAPQLKTMVAQR